MTTTYLRRVEEATYFLSYVYYSIQNTHTVGILIITHTDTESIVLTATQHFNNAITTNETVGSWTHVNTHLRVYAHQSDNLFATTLRMHPYELPLELLQQERVG